MTSNLGETLAEVSVDEQGALQYFGATSRFSIAGTGAVYRNVD